MSENGATKGSAWRQAREEGYLKLLPSGYQVYLRPVTPALLLEHLGEIPDALTSYAADLIFQGAEERLASVKRLADEIGQAEDGSPEKLARARAGVAFADTVCRLAFVQPKIVDNPQADDEISLADVDLGDRLVVLQLVTQPQEVLRRFSWQPEPGLEATPDREPIRPAPQ